MLARCRTSRPCACRSAVELAYLDVAGHISLRLEDLSLDPA